MKDDGEQPVDLTTIAADEALLDALGHGHDAPGDDRIAAMLAAWRSELADGDDSPERGAELIRAAVAGADDPHSESPPRPFLGWLLNVAAGVVVVAGLAGGLAVASNHAGPTSALWPVTRVLYPQQADVRAAEHTIERARVAAGAGRFDEARRLLDEALRQVARIDDATVADRLRAEAASVLRTLPTTEPSPVPQAATPAPAPATTTAPPPASTREPAPADTSREPDQRILPELSPSAPLPSLSPAPVPPLLSPSLPGLLPLPTDGLLE